MIIFSSRDNDDVKIYDFINFAFAKLNISEHQSRRIYIRYIFEIDAVLFDD